MKRNKPLVTWRCAKSMSGTVVIERPLYLEHEAETCEYNQTVAVRQRVSNKLNAQGLEGKRPRVEGRCTQQLPPKGHYLVEIGVKEGKQWDRRPRDKSEFGGLLLYRWAREGYKREAPTSARSLQSGDGRL